MRTHRQGDPWGVALLVAGLSGCATLVLEGPEGIGSATTAGRGRAVVSARAARALLASPVRFTLDVAGGEEVFQWAVPADSGTEVVLERRAGLWVATGGVASQSGRCAATSHETVTAESTEVDEALARAERQAARKLARAAVTAPEGRFSGAVVVTHRRVEANGRRVQVTLEGCVSEARAEALGPVDACRLALTGLSRHTDEAARWDGLAVRCPASLGNDVAAAVRRWPGLDAAGRRAVVDDLSSALEAGVRAERRDATASSTDASVATRTPPSVPVSAAFPSPGAVEVSRAPPVPARAPSPAAPASVSVVLNVNVSDGATAAVQREAVSPPVLRCPEGMVLFARPALTSTESDRTSFCLDRTEVTEKAYRGFGTRRPAASVSWREADAFCRQRGGRLPTEAEWLQAATGGGGRTHPWGEEAPTCERVNTNVCEGTTRVVDAAGDVTPEGVFGLGGNVAEWTADGWGGDRPGARVVRGGAFHLPPSATSNAYRAGRDWNESYRDGGLGFRCAGDPVVEAGTPAK